MRRSDRFMHQMGLGFAPLAEFAHDWEHARFGSRADLIEGGSPVFVVGFARSGTTILTRLLHKTGQFASLTYRDMPFPLAPNLWASSSRQFDRINIATERGHGDGLLHDLDSPEAIEEVFWRHFEGRRYIHHEKLSAVQPTSASIVAFRRYVSLILLRYQQARYLSKNNNNILRVPALAEMFPTAVFVHPFRDPLQQASSLLNQHQRAVALHAADPFHSQYMGWLGHHEFGSDHRPFDFGSDNIQGLTPEEPDYWLARWIEAYRHLAEAAKSTCHLFVDFDRLCTSPMALRDELASAVGVNANLFDMTSCKPVRLHQNGAFDQNLAKVALEIREELRRI
jgi:Sulfotransferase family